MEAESKKSVLNQSVAEGIFFATLVLILILPYDKDLMDPVLLPRFILTTFFLLILSAWVIFFHPDRQKFPYIPLFKDFTLFLYFLYGLIGFLSVFYSGNQADGIFEWLKWGYGVIFFLLMYHLGARSQTFMRSMVYGFIFITFLSLVSGAFQLMRVIESFDISLHASYLVSGPFGHKNIFAQILLIALPFSIYGALKWNNLIKYISWVNIAGSIGFIAILLSRGAWVALVIAGLGTFGFFLLTNRKLKIPNLTFRYLPLLTFVLVGIIGSGIFYANTDKSLSFSERIASITNFSHYSTKDRIGLWQRSFKLFTEKPIQGHGMASWKVEVVKLGTHGLKTDTGEITYVRPHNDYFWILSEQGLVGFIPYFLFLILLFARLYTLLRKQKNDRSFYLAITFALIAYLSIAFFSFPKERIEHVLIFHLLIVPIFFNNKVSEKEESKLVRISAFSLIAIILILGGWIGLKRYQGEKHINKAITLQNRGQWKRALEELESIDLRYLPMDHTATPVELYIGSIYIREYQPKFGCSAYQRAFEKHPWHPGVKTGLGKCYKMSGQFEKAEEFYVNAFETTPANNQTLMEIANIYLEQNKLQLALEAIRKIDPKFKDKGYERLLEKAIQLEISSILSEDSESKLAKFLADSLRKLPKLEYIYRESVYENHSFKHQLETYIP